MFFLSIPSPLDWNIFIGIRALFFFFTLSIAFYIAQAILFTSYYLSLFLEWN